MENNQKGDLISREALRKQLKELLDLAVKRVNDTPNNSPCYRMYVEQENERARLIDLIDNAPPVDITRICMEHYKQGRKDEKAEANGELIQSFSP